MKKIDPTVKKETAYIAAVSIVASLLMQSVFLIIRHWDYTVLLGNLLGLLGGVGNFFLMALTVQAALNKEGKEAKNTIRLSQHMRLLMLFAVALIGYLVPVFHLVAVVIPFVFPRLAVALSPWLRRNKNE